MATLAIVDKVCCALFVFDPVTKVMETPIIELDGTSMFISNYQDTEKHLYQGTNAALCDAKILADGITNPYI